MAGTTDGRPEAALSQTARIREASKKREPRRRLPSPVEALPGAGRRSRGDGPPAYVSRHSCHLSDGANPLLFQASTRRGKVSSNAPVT
jgi:hypothetical protein